MAVDTWFHATLLIHNVLLTVGPWRFRAHEGQVRQGFTQVWLHDAPAIDLEMEMYRMKAELRTPQSTRRRRGAVTNKTVRPHSPSITKD